jgi:hypothetical protein
MKLARPLPPAAAPAAAGDYDVAGDGPLMSTLDVALARVPADEWRTRAASDAREIRGSPAANPAR